ncbi:hypothetical protein GWI33_017074 [Rhynchophorus ferrugineus]|uniref:Uncharacterized protein n=1 Tax=Rhynchophorus ferrugineus TaxID=354439 RepID=A0A834HZL4_RHYFE|nr:hypothetical protein GWI33_017074 [Rhynchophorus ferrugineus]
MNPSNNYINRVKSPPLRTPGARPRRKTSDFIQRSRASPEVSCECRVNHVRDFIGDIKSGPDNRITELASEQEPSVIVIVVVPMMSHRFTTPGVVHGCLGDRYAYNGREYEYAPSLELVICDVAKAFADTGRQLNRSKHSIRNSSVIA